MDSWLGDILPTVQWGSATDIDSAAHARDQRWEAEVCSSEADLPDDANGWVRLPGGWYYEFWHFLGNLFAWLLIATAWIVVCMALLGVYARHVWRKADLETIECAAAAAAATAAAAAEGCSGDIDLTASPAEVLTSSPYFAPVKWRGELGVHVGLRRSERALVRSCMATHR
jgi:hypothetical protein